VPNRTYVLFQPHQRSLGKVANFTGLAMSPARYRHTYNLGELVRDILSMTKAVKEPELEQLNYSESLAHARPVIDFKFDNDGELVPFE
jgi:hypothetical protein